LFYRSPADGANILREYGTGLKVLYYYSDKSYSHVHHAGFHVWSSIRALFKFIVYTGWLKVAETLISKYITNDIGLWIPSQFDNLNYSTRTVILVLT
jgi:hypothetical protein